MPKERMIDANALLERMKKDPLFPFVEEYGISRVIEAEPTVEAIPIEWIKKWMEWQNSWNLEGVITLMREWAERKEEKERTCYNCKHGAFGFDGDLGCSLWHRGIYDQKICGCWEGFERKEE